MSAQYRPALMPQSAAVVPICVVLALAHDALAFPGNRSKVHGEREKVRCEALVFARHALALYLAALASHLDALALYAHA